MKITELEGGQFSATANPINIKEPERQKIQDDIANFERSGGTIESIPTGLSGNMYSSRPLTQKQTREKLKIAVKLQRARKQA
ncbi:MAG: hypothetical protein V3V40_06080 [Nitrosomonadaceae bacterium]